MTFFAYVAYMNIQSTRVLAGQQVDRQLLKIVLIVIISYVQYGIYNGYLLLTANMTKGADRLALDRLFGSISSLFCYFYFFVCFLFKFYLGHLLHVFAFIEKLLRNWFFDEHHQIK